jgi:glc operon protein GlcG
MGALTVKRLEKCLRQGKLKAQDLGVEAAIVVVDEAGHLAAALRMDNALWVTPEIAQAKAVTASAFRATTAELEERWKARPLFAASIVGLGPGRFVVGKGGVPIIVDGRVIGAVGVSGGIPADLDHQIAEAAVEDSPE